MQLTGKLLVAMPGLQDPRFDHAVILICSHGDEGAMGLILNKPMRELGFSALLDQLDITHGQALQAIPCLYGGPVERGRGFVLHGDSHTPSEGRFYVAGGFSVTTSRDILVDLAEGRGPKEAMLALGYAGWGAGQLEAEIARNDWLTVDADPDLVFSAATPAKWGKALAVLGIDPLTLSATAGRA
jgi:putative transcriptional regulator